MSVRERAEHLITLADKAEAIRTERLENLPGSLPVDAPLVVSEGVWAARQLLEALN